MSAHTIEELAEASDAEARAIASARTELREGPQCLPECMCQCRATQCGCHDEERMSWRSREAIPVPLSDEVAQAAGRG